MVGKSKPANKAGKWRMSLIKEQAWCVPCILNFTPNRSATEVHHPVSGNKRTGKTMGLCGWHHRGINEGAMFRQDMQKMFGASLAHGSREFVRVWGSEDVLVQLQNQLIDIWVETGGWDQYNLPRDVQYEIRKQWQTLQGLR